MYIIHCLIVYAQVYAQLFVLSLYFTLQKLVGPSTFGLNIRIGQPNTLYAFHLFLIFSYSKFIFTFSYFLCGKNPLPLKKS